MSDPEDPTESGRGGRRHARRPAPQDGAPGQGDWPSRYGPRPDFTVPPDGVGTLPGEAQPPGPPAPPGRPGRHAGRGQGADPDPGLDPGPDRGFDPGPDRGFDPGPGPRRDPGPGRGSGSYQGARRSGRPDPLTDPSYARPGRPATPPHPSFTPRPGPDDDGYGGGRRRRPGPPDPSYPPGYAGPDGYAGRGDPYAGRDGYSGRDDPYGERDGYSGRRRRDPDGYPGQDDQAEPDGYTSHVAGPGYPGHDAAPGGEGPRWDEDEYEDDDRFVPGLGGPRDADDDADDGPHRGGRGGRGGRRSGRGGGGTGKRRRRWLIPLVVILIIILIPLGVAGFYAFRFVQGHYYPADYTTAGTGQVIAQVQSGQTATAVGSRLVTLGVVASVRAFELAAEHNPNGRGLEPGFYRLHKHMKASLAFKLLLTPSARIQDRITIPEGWRLSQIEAQLGAHSGIPLANFRQALSQPAALGLPPYANGKPEGYLFPATYDVQPNQTATDVLKAMVQRFEQEVASDNLTQAASSVHLSPGQVITVASLIQAEGGSTSYYPQIARVIYNRLADHMKLQLDSTVMYGLNTFGIIASNQQLRSTSPYNTYRYAGLPPGPIDSPGHAAIEAALHPAAGNDLYFVTVNPKTGLTKFTSSQTQFEQFRQELEHNLGH